MSIKVNKSGTIKEVTGGGNIHVAIIYSTSGSAQYQKGSYYVDDIVIAKGAEGTVSYQLPFTPTVVYGLSLGSGSSDNAYTIAIVQNESVEVATSAFATGTRHYTMTLNGDHIDFYSEKSTSSDCRPKMVLIAVG